MKCDTPFWIKIKGRLKDVPVRCGRCPPCKKARVDSWVVRLMEQSKTSESSYFITLTYNTNEVPITKNGFMTLDKSDYQKYMKRLRKREKDAKIKYYACGEYGEQYMRPHYHAILFNVRNIQNIVDAWNEKGKVHIGKLTQKSAAYCCKYLDKTKQIPQHNRDDRLEEFSLMSKGLGDSYINERTKKYHKSDIERNYYTLEGGVKTALPRYYRERIYSPSERNKQNAIITEKLKEQTKEQRLNFEQKFKNTKITFDEYEDSKRYGRYDKFHKNRNKRNQN